MVSGFYGERGGAANGGFPRGETVSPRPAAARAETLANSCRRTKSGIGASDCLSRSAIASPLSAAATSATVIRGKVGLASRILDSGKCGDSCMGQPFLRSCRLFRPILDVQSRNRLEVANVAGHHRAAVLKRCGRDLQVHLANLQSAAFEFFITVNRSFIVVKNLDVPQEADGLGKPAVSPRTPF